MPHLTPTTVPSLNYRGISDFRQPQPSLKRNGGGAGCAPSYFSGPSRGSGFMTLSLRVPCGEDRPCGLQRLSVKELRSGDVSTESRSWARLLPSLRTSQVQEVAPSFLHLLRFVPYEAGRLFVSDASCPQVSNKLKTCQLPLPIMSNGSIMQSDLVEAQNRPQGTKRFDDIPTHPVLISTARPGELSYNLQMCPGGWNCTGRAQG